MNRSVFQYTGMNNGGWCGYCKQEDSNKASAGMWAYRLSTTDYNMALDRGMRRSGRYLYKPNIKTTCCPQYTIRLNANEFRLTRSLKAVLRHMNDYLTKDVKPNTKNFQTIDEAKSDRLFKEKADDTNGNTLPTLNVAGNIRTGDPAKRGKKKREMRKERAFEKMRKKGINVEEAKRNFMAKEAARRRTVESFILRNEKDFAHKLEITLIGVDSVGFELTFKESFALFVKYQTVVHNDPDCTEQGFTNFLAESPIFSDEDAKAAEGKSVKLGSYHQHYRLDGKLIAVGVIDILPRCLSSKYTFYDPDYDFLCLGTYTALREIAFVRELAKERPELHYYYMGYYIDSCPKMRYKSRFQPSELLCDRSFTWVPFDECKKLLTKEKNVAAFAPNAPASPHYSLDTVMCLMHGTVVPYSVLKSKGIAVAADRSVEEYVKMVGPVAQRACLVFAH